MRPGVRIIASAALGLVLAAPAAAAPPRLAELPVVPRIDAAMAERLRAVAAAGATRGNRPDVFAKVGDSISAGSAFLAALDCDVPPRWGRHAGLKATAAVFGRRTVGRSSVPGCARATSFGRSSIAAVSGWRVEDPLTAPRGRAAHACRRRETPLACEYRLLKPAVAIVMLGTNDVGGDPDPATYARGLHRLVRRSLARGVIPIVSTIPPRQDHRRYARRVVPYNRAIAAVAKDEGVPLLNLWRALQGPRVIAHGLREDGVHLAVMGGCAPGCWSLDFTARGLRYGVNQRNLTALQALRKVRRVVLQGLAPDP